ncbi:TusE/DsrC/DsvC family sulfur relay protein, partial [Pseudomonas aeruginosa]|uniref:TusE/DsrC/DsvC family sulfur relay protein n=1 Tax=Pseudomonas aeruginosa TaxID=287 RepID=UPI00396A8661
RRVDALPANFPLGEEQYRPLIKYVAQRLGPDKGNSLHLNHLFKGAPAKLGAKLAGLPKPSNCL